MNLAFSGRYKSVHNRVYLVQSSMSVLINDFHFV